MFPRRLRIAGALLALLAILVASGGHWLLLQSVAWANMIVAFSQTDSLTTALEKTFDGRHPCPLCKKIQQGRKTEQQKQPLLRLERMPEWICDPARVTIPQPACWDPSPTGFRNRFHTDFLPEPLEPPPKTG